MKKLILIILVCVLSTLSLSASIWERVDGPYDYAFIADIFEFNNQLFASSNSDFANYQFNDETEWEISNLELPSNRSILFFKQEDSIVIFSTIVELYLSTNYGVSWMSIRDTLDGIVISRLQDALIVDNKIFAFSEYGSSKKLYMYDLLTGKWDTIKTVSEETVLSNTITRDKNYLFSASYGNPQIPNSDYGLFISSDNGESWEKSNFNETRIKSFVVHNSILFACGLDKHLYKSSDYGETWGVDTNLILPVDLFYSSGDYLYAAVNSVGIQDGIGTGVHISTDNGQTWERRHDGIELTNIKQFLEFNGVLYCQNENKYLFNTTNQGKVWEKCKAMTDSLVSYSFHTNQDTLLVATSGRNGLHYSTSEGTNWQLLGNGLKGINLKVHQRDSIYITIVSGYQNIGLSNDFGKTWNEVGIGVSDPFRTIIKDVEYIGGDTLIVATLFGTRITTDFGKTWNGFQNEILKSDYATTNILRIDNKKLLIVAEDKGLFKSFNNGLEWEKVPTDFQTLYSTKFETFEYHDGKVYAFLPNHGLFYSEDEGLTWDEFNSEISLKGSDNGLVFYGEYTIVSSKDGVLVSNNEGENTTYYEIEIFASDDSFETIVKDIAIQGEYILVASGDGVWRSKLSDLGIVKSSVDSELIPNSYYPYPQPAHSEVTIEFGNYNLVDKNISIYNVEGKGLRNQIIRINNNSIIWDCSAVQPGIYLINIKHGSEEKAVKVVVE
ncbi:MAG: T9SS type A sorting domain-containing protein [Candidatus Kapaibacterium sp.]